MKTKKPTSKLILVMIVSILAATTNSVTFADVVGTDELLLQSEAESKRSQLITSLARDEVRQKLQSMGVSAGDVQQRVDALTDAEVIQLSEKMDDMPAGGVLGTIIAVLVIFILLDVAGATDIFPGV